MTEHELSSQNNAEPEPSLADLTERLWQLEQQRAAGSLSDIEYRATAGQLAEAVEAARSRLGVYERDGDTYRAHQLGLDDRPAMADYLVRRDSDGRYGGYVADLALDDEGNALGPDEPRFEAYDDRGQYLASTSSLRGALSVFAQPGRDIRWISDQLTAAALEPDA
jgi:hypothetical protein